MPVEYEIEYFHSRVLADIEAWPVDVLADYARLVELLAEHGPNLRLPHSRALGDGLFEKKTQQTPEKDMKLARKRMKELSNG
jgi:hypothetical protein